MSAARDSDDMSSQNGSRSARLESGTTLVSTNIRSLDQLPHLNPSATGSRLGELEPPKKDPSLHEIGQQHEDIQPNWKRRLSRFWSAQPRLRRYYMWLSGPTPPYVLQPSPKLDSTVLRWRTHTLHINLSLESWWLKHTNMFRRQWLFFLLAAAYIIGLAFISRTNSFMTPAESFVGCTSTYWTRDDSCGLNGQLCSPFTGPDFQFRCPGDCLSVTLANPRTVGAQQITNDRLVVGGGDSNRTYRGDSWICPAAIQAGIVSPRTGGCGTLRLVGNYTDFLPANANGVSSIGFPSVFPLSFRFLDSVSSDYYCVDVRNYALLYNVLCTIILLLLLRPPPIYIFWSLLCIGFWHISLFSDTRFAVPDLSGAFGTFLPVLFVGYAFWRSAWRFTLPAFETLPLERALWFLGPFWAGVYFNVITARIPMDRLVSADLRQSDAIAAIVVIVIIVAALVLNQLRIMRKTGVLLYYLSRYAIVGIVVTVLACLPTLTFRLHHYIAAILLTPITAFPTRISVICQAFILGMLLQGVAKFGFDPILESAAELRRDAAIGTSIPLFDTNSTTTITNFTDFSVTWSPISVELADSEGWDGFSLLVDDVQRLAGQALSYGIAGLQTGIPHFFRLAYQRNGQSGDYSKAAILYPNGTWSDPLPGPS